MKTISTQRFLSKKPITVLFMGLLLFLFCSAANAQLGVYSFTGLGTCPHQNPAVNSQPANATFSNYVFAGTISCKARANEFETMDWANTNNTVINPNEYFGFTVTPSAGYNLTLTQLTFNQRYDRDPASGVTRYVLRSSLDNFTSDIAVDTVTLIMQTDVINLPASSFTNIGAVTFRLYLLNCNSTLLVNWRNDEVTLNGTVANVVLPVNPPNPISNSPQCYTPTGVTMNFNGSPPSNQAWYWQTGASGTTTANSASSYTVTSSGIYYLRARNDTSLLWSAGAGSINVVVNQPAGSPLFTLGTNSTRCQGAATVSYAATSAFSTSINYSLDAASLAAGNTINSANGAVTYTTIWSGNSVITATAIGCDAGQASANHTATTNLATGTPVFALGTTSNRCSGAQTILYNASAANSTGITYSLDAASLTAGYTINSSTGSVTYNATNVTTTVITAIASGCGAPTSSTHTVTLTGTVATPTFTAGSTSSRCQNAGTVTYTANAASNWGLTYSLDAASLSGGNTINASTGEVTYIVGWSGTTTVTVSAAGCGGPKAANHVVTVNAYVGVPVFTLGSTSTRCRASGTVTYGATASSSTGITYTLDATSLGGSNTINSSTGAVTYSGGWSGTSVITASAAGCSGPQTSTHTVTITDQVSTPVFTMGSTSTRCQGPLTVFYDATASNTTGITYSLNAAALTAGNTINASSGGVNYVSGWTGSTIITASAAGCSGPKTATHTVTITPTVGNPVFTLGSSSIRCQLGSAVTYTATASNNSGLSYSLDATSLGAGNTINASNGTVSYNAAWSGASIITVTATGCNGPVSANHAVTITPTVGVPDFVLGTTTVRCQGAGSITYTANSSNATSITYSLDGASITGGNSINSTTGQVIYSSGWSGTTSITASAAGCNGPKTAIHTVTITPTVGTPVFTMGASSTRCQGTNAVSYTANATTNTGITYSLDGASISAGNTINVNTGTVNYIMGWWGTSTITASATGCNGPKTANHTVTITQTVGTPAFVQGIFSTRNQSAGTVTYTATASNSTSISYSLDAASLAGGNTINASTGAVTFSANWNGNTTITASSAGCNGPYNASHIVFINPSVVGMPLYLSEPGQSLDRIDPVATNDNTTSTTPNLSNVGAGVSVDVSSSGFSANPGSTSFAVTHVTGSGSNRFMLVGISQRNRVVTGVTYAGQTMNMVGESLSTSARMHIYSLVNPPSGSNAVVVSFDANPDKGIIVGVTTFNGVNPSTPLGVFTGTTGSSSSASTSITTGTGEVIYNVASARNTAITADVAQTVRHNINSTNEMYGGAGTIPGSATGSATPVWTLASSGSWAIGGVSIKPAAGITSTSFTPAPVLCSPLTIKSGQNITFINYVNIASGTMPINPAITAQLRYGATNIISLTNPTYNSSAGTLTWSGQLGADLTVPTGQNISYVVSTAQAGVSFSILYDSETKPSKINLPVSTYIDIQSMEVYNAPFPGGTILTTGLNNTTVYLRAVVAAPFGSGDISGMDISIAPPITNYTATQVASTSCTKTYQIPWTTPSTSGNYDITGTAFQGFENSVTRKLNFNIVLCSTCPPVAMPDSARGAGGAPLIIDALANDNDPNNNINPSSLNIVTQPNNGSVYLANNKVVYLPNGTYAGRDTIVYEICDSTAPTPLCANGYIYITIDPTIVDPCSDATKNHTYYIPYPEQEAFVALVASASNAIPSNNIRTIISLKMPYPGMTIVWDEWEDGYEVNALNPMQATTKVWGDGNPYNGIAPGYANDIIPAGGSIVLDNTMPANPRVQSNIFFDGKDKITASGQVSITQVCGEPTWMPVQAIKTNVTSTYDFGQSFTIPLGQNFPSRDFAYTALFIRAAQNNTEVSIDKDNNGSFETIVTLNEGQCYLVNGGVLVGATIASDKPVGVELNAGGIDQYSIRNAPIYPATWYSHTYYSPVPTSDNASDNPKDTSVVMFYNSLNRSININWTSGIPSSGTITLPAKSVVRFPLAYSTTAAYKFVNPTGESYTAIEIVDSYTPGGGGNNGTTYDWSFNLIAESRLTDFATVAWAPGGLDLVAPPGPDVNGNPIWVTPSANTTVYVKYDGDVSGTTGLLSPCNLRYDVAYTLNALNYIKIRDMADNDQSGIAVYTCNGAKLAAVYGEDPMGSGTGIGVAYWDVGTTIQPFCKQKLIFANDDYARTLVNQPVTIPILLNDHGFLAVVNPSSVNTTGLLQPKNGSVTINTNGTVIYTPNLGYVGNDTFEYNVCSTPTPVVCDKATVYVQIATCPAPVNQNLISGNVFLDKNKDGLNNDGGTGYTPAKVYLYIDGNCNGVPEANELKDSVNVDSSGSYQFITYPEKEVRDDFDGTGGARTCANGTDGNTAWKSDWVDQGDPSTGYCNTSQSQSNTHAEIYKDGAFTNALRLKNRNVSATRTIDLGGASYAFLSFSYRRKSATLASGDNVIVQASSNGTTFGTIFTIAGDGTTDANYVNIYNQDISAYAATTTYIRFLTNNNMSDNDTVYIDNVSVKFIKYPQCYITAINSSLIPSIYYLTTVGTRAMTATNGITCLAPHDFGVARNSVTISGTLLNDANGMTDNLVNGPPVGSPGSTNVYAYLVDSLDKIAFKTMINASNGTYSFPLADVQTNYTVVLSTDNINSGFAAPSDFNLPADWVATGAAYGSNNLMGTGNKPGYPNGTVPVRTGIVNVTGVNLGIERLPDSHEKFASYTLNIPGTLYAVPALTGIDPEDGALGNGKTYKITSLPTAAVLYYNNVSVVLNQIISNFNPALLKIDPDDNTRVTSFTYAAQDAALQWDPTPARVQVDWVAILPVKLLNFSGRLNGKQVDLNWVTASEYNSSYFDVERSADGRNFAKIKQVAANNNTSTTSSYTTVDPSPLNGLNYYRLKMVDRDGAFEYSNIVIIRIADNKELVTKFGPNPFKDKLDIYLSLTHASNVDFTFIDLNGRVVFKKSVNGLKGLNWFTITDLGKLPPAAYMLKINTDDTEVVEKLIKQ